jgi:hypothetical protein
MMSAEVLFIGSVICFVLGFLKPIESLMPVGFLMLVMAVSIWVRERKKETMIVSIRQDMVNGHHVTIIILI